MSGESPTRASMSATAAPRSRTPCTASGSATMSRTRRRGFSEDCGSWNTGWISRARSRRPSAARSCPNSRTVAGIRAGQPQQQPRQAGLAAARLADDAQHAALGHRQRDPVHATAHRGRRRATPVAPPARSSRLHLAGVAVPGPACAHRHVAGAGRQRLRAAVAERAAGEARRQARHQAGDAAQRLAAAGARRVGHGWRAGRACRGAPGGRTGRRPARSPPRRRRTARSPGPPPGRRCRGRA